MSRVLVTVAGGIAEVFVEDGSAEVLVVDYDTDGDQDTVKDPSGDECMMYHGANINPQAVAKFFDHFK